MAINVKVKSDEEIQAEKEKENAIQIVLKIRKTLDGKIMILDHTHIDIIVDTAQNKIITFPKDEMSDEVYEVQNSYFRYLIQEGVADPSSIQAGNVYGSLEGIYPKPVDENISDAQIVLLSTKKFLETQKSLFQTEEFIEDKIEDRFVEPTPEDSTPLGKVPEEPKKGSISPSRVRRYLGGFGYYEE